MTPNSLLVEPAFATRPAYRDTLGPEVADVCRMAGFAPDPEQQIGLDMLFAFGPSGKVSAFEFALICSRQNMKTGLFKMAALGWLFVTEQRLIVWSAHEMKTTKEAFRDLEDLITGCPALKSRLADGPSEGIHRGNGEETIELATGQRVMFKARTNGGGRGLSGDKVILDEAFALQASHMGSLLPTLSARPDPQVVYGSSAGLAASAVLREIRDRGRAGGEPSLAYLEWCDDLPGTCGEPNCDHALSRVDCRLDDPARWQRANPQMGRRITRDYIANERRALSQDPMEFARERLGWWDEPSGEALISPLSWKACEDPAASMVRAPKFALDVSPDRSWSAIAAAGKTKAGLPLVEVTSHAGVVDHRPGTDWVLARLADLNTRFPDLAVVIAAGSGAETLKPAIEAVGIKVETLGSALVAAACGLFYDKAVTEGLVHLGQAELNDALMSARKHVENGENAWKWGRKRSANDITPLYAATLALWVDDQAVIEPTISFI